MPKIGITTGDTDGIGLEVTLKALQKILSSKSARKKKSSRLEKLTESVFVVWISSETTAREIKKYFHLPFQFSDDAISANDLRSTVQDFVFSDDDCSVLFLRRRSSAAFWVEEAARACLSGDLDAMATAPLSKALIQRSGLKDMGHTGILKRVCKTDSVFMGFIGQHLRVLLVTDHQPLAKVASLTQRRLASALEQAALFHASLGDSKPIGVLGLNPHSGEGGLIGHEESKLVREITKMNLKLGRDIFHGLLVPDVAFQEKTRKKFSLLVALYHDQGLIPFKMLHGQDDGIQISIGLPIIRTSVDHGTAQDIFGRGVANAGSMISAIEWAANLARRKNKATGLKKLPLPKKAKPRKRR